MAHCWSVTAEIDGRQQRVCTSHVPGNEALQKDLEEKRLRRPTKEEVGRAVEFYRTTKGRQHRTQEEKLEDLIEP